MEDSTVSMLVKIMIVGLAVILGLLLILYLAGWRWASSSTTNNTSDDCSSAMSGGSSEQAETCPKKKKTSTSCPGTTTPTPAPVLPYTATQLDATCFVLTNGDAAPLGGSTLLTWVASSAAANVSTQITADGRYFVLYNPGFVSAGSLTIFAATSAADPTARALPAPTVAFFGNSARTQFADGPAVYWSNFLNSSVDGKFNVALPPGYNGTQKLYIWVVKHT